MKSLRPLFHQISETLLPEMAKAALPQIVVEQLHTLALEQQADSIVLTMSAADRAAIEAATKGTGTYSISLVTNPAFSHGQVEISDGQEERSINLKQVVDDVAAALAAFSNEAERIDKHG